MEPAAVTAEPGRFAKLAAVPVIGGIVCFIVAFMPTILVVEMQDRMGYMSDNSADFWSAIFTFFWLYFVEKTTRVRITLPIIPIPVIWLPPVWLVIWLYHVTVG